ncbi:anti-sigma-F factor Fin family protein [Halalkalibacter nanhaiisediminis]|uniref:Uncharacterized protein DUF2757 n=1 Tax=Halalkalibacter nanhaiisediminis TaxID=688079 RepID=A0A562QB30_9BACI|nr:anti-sigma-F factor Fin family protein [Halalkalibacter nanhaiisediminis]TWI53226.1 uncharacterized protein DUF2757 [Halalkalibacter nanhaiisediminis]
MTIHYECRHCHAKLGAISHQVSSESLGFHHLTSTERTDMLTYTANGDIHVNVICEDCHESLTRNPDFYELDKIIQ